MAERGEERRDAAKRTARSRLMSAVRAAFDAPGDEFSVEPSFSTYQIAGKRYPVVVSSENVEEPHDMTVRLKSREEAMRFYEAVRSCEPMVFKTLYGFVFHGVAKASFTPSLGNAERAWDVSLNVTRTDGEAL